MTNIELFKNADTLDAMWAKRLRVVLEGSAHDPKICNPGDVDEHTAYHTVCPEEATKHLQSPIHWAMSGADDALLPEFDPGRLVVCSEPGLDWSGKYGVVVGCDCSAWGPMYRRLSHVLVDFGDGKPRSCRCAWLKKSDIPKGVLELAESRCRQDALKRRVHEKVDEAFA